MPYQQESGRRSQLPWVMPNPVLATINCFFNTRSSITCWKMSHILCRRIAERLYSQTTSFKKIAL